MGDDLKILLTGTLNTGKTIGEINTAIKGIEKAIQKVKLNVTVDDKAAIAIKNLTSFTSDYNRTVKEEIETLKHADGTIEKVIKQYKANGEIFQRTTKQMKEKTDTVEKDTQAITAQTTALQQQGKVLKEVISKNANGEQLSKSITTSLNGVSTVNKYGVNNNPVGTTTTVNYDQQVKQIQKLENSLLSLYNQGKITETRFQRFNNLLNSAKNISEVEKLNTRVNSLTSSFNKMKQTADNINLKDKLLSDANSLLTMNPRSLDKTQLNQVITSLKQIQPNASNASNSLKQLESQFKRIKTAAKDAAGQSMGLADSFNTAMVKYPVWMAATTLFIGIPRVINNAIDTIVDLDTKLVSLKKVMNEDTNFENIMDRATASAKEFGKTLTDVMDSYTEFARQGYSEDDIPLLSDAALVTSNVGEISAGQAAEYLTSTLIQMKLEAKDAMSVIDSWNSISNQNATTVEKLAQGYTRAASVARTWQMDMHELNAVIGAVTAATKQSGKPSLPPTLAIA